MSKMKAVRVEKFGGPSVLEIQTIDVPPLEENQILVKVYSAGVNPVDTYIRQGAFGYLPELPFTPGKDGAGIICKVGPNSQYAKEMGFAEGTRVFVCSKTVKRYGTYAEYAIVDENDVFHLKNTISFDEGAAIGIPYFTAYRALLIKAKCVPGETVLIHGASGAVGLSTLQIAKHYGCKVIGTAGSPEGMKLVKQVGADYVLNHKDKNYMERVLEITDNAGVDIIVEMLANINFDKDLDVLAPLGRLAIVGSRGLTKVDPRKLMKNEIQVFGVALLNSNKVEWRETADAVKKLLEDGIIKPVIDKKYPLSQAAEAHKYIMNSDGAKGKIILTVREDETN